MITKENIQALPSLPGVYIFFQRNIPLYIGKSVNIKVRVRSHVAQASLSKKEKLIIESSDRIEALETFSNFDALLLEAKLIREHKPKYNVIWKDDKNYLYIKVTKHDTYPKISVVRKENKKNAIYFGPFQSSKVARMIINEMRYIVPFCTSTSIEKRPCFYSRIGLCDPCPSYIESLCEGSDKNSLKHQYNNNIHKILTILSGTSNILIKKYENQLSKLSDEMNYESAIDLRTNLLYMKSFLSRNQYLTIEDADSMDKITIKKQLQQFLYHYFGVSLKKSSYRLECYDISTINRSYAVGSMIVFVNGSFIKKDYRKFKIKNNALLSDSDMMGEVIERRLAHKEWPLPDMIILDGGKPQMRVVYKLFMSHKITIPLCSLAKAPDRLLIPRDNFKVVHVDRSSLLFRIIQALRDESHRFAKKYHVSLRNKNVLY